MNSNKFNLVLGHKIKHKTKRNLCPKEGRLPLILVQKRPQKSKSKVVELNSSVEIAKLKVMNRCRILSVLQWKNCLCD